MKKIIELFIAALGSAVAVKLSKHYGEQDWISTPYDLILAVVISVALVISLRFVLLQLPYNVKITRKLLDKRASYEGLYYEIFASRQDNIVSISRVKYLKQSKSYEYYGNNYYIDGSAQPAESWESEKATIDPEQETLEYFFTTKYFGATERATTGFGHISFKNGTGQYFNLSDSDLERHSHQLKRVNRSDLRRYFGTSSDPKQDDWYKLAKKIVDDLARDT